MRVTCLEKFYHLAEDAFSVQVQRDMDADSLLLEELLDGLLLGRVHSDYRLREQKCDNLVFVFI